MALAASIPNRRLGPLSLSLTPRGPPSNADANGAGSAPLNRELLESVKRMPGTGNRLHAAGVDR